MSAGLTPAQQRGQELICAADRARIRWTFDTAATLAPLLGEESFYPVLTLCKLGHSIGQIAKSVRNAGLVIAGGIVGRLPKLDPSHTGLIHHASPLLDGFDNQSVGGGGPGPAAHVGPGRPLGGAR